MFERNHFIDERIQHQVQSRQQFNIRMKLTEIKKLARSGIPHIEDLAIAEFVSALHNLDDYEISEKVDGANIQFGIDQTGFYTSREDFGGKRVYNVDDYPIAYQTTFLRSAHVALEKVLPLMRSAGLRIGDKVEAEVLYGALPNAIRYHADENRIIFLHTVEGNVNISNLKYSLDGKKANVSLVVPYTTNGKTIETAVEEDVWSFEQTPIVPGDMLSALEMKQELASHIKELNHYLRQDSGIHTFTNADILALPLNKRPDGIDVSDWKQLKDHVRVKKEDINRELESAAGHKTNIKQTLLNNFVRKVKSAFGPEIEDGGWIEGVVFKHKHTGKMFKVVDKDVFTSIKDFLWKVRNDLSENPKSINKIESFLGDLTTKLGSSIGYPELGTIQAKRILRKLGDTPDEIVAVISENIDFHEVKTFWINLLEEKKHELEKKLDHYHENVHALQKGVDFGKQGKRTFAYDTEINSRTLQVFSSLHHKLDELETKISAASTPEELVIAFMGKQLSEL